MGWYERKFRDKILSAFVAVEIWMRPWFMNEICVSIFVYNKPDSEYLKKVLMEPVFFASVSFSLSLKYVSQYLFTRSPYLVLVIELSTRGWQGEGSYIVILEQKGVLKCKDASFIISLNLECPQKGWWESNICKYLVPLYEFPEKKLLQGFVISRTEL